jgi:hypothetical protein
LNSKHSNQIEGEGVELFKELILVTMEQIILVIDIDLRIIDSISMAVLACLLGCNHLFHRHGDLHDRCLCNFLYFVLLSMTLLGFDIIRSSIDIEGNPFEVLMDLLVDPEANLRVQGIIQITEEVIILVGKFLEVAFNLVESSFIVI